MIELPTDLPADLVPLSWLLGVWEGTGVIDYETADGLRLEGEFSHRVSFSHDGGDYLNYSAQARLLTEPQTPLVAETGFWRLGRPATASDAGPGLLPATAEAPPRTVDDIEAMRTPEGGFAIEVALVHADGVSELYMGQVRGPRIDIATDAVMRSASTKPYAAATRMYGLVDNHLLWAWDIAALGSPLASHASARLARVQ
ncbi:FABP family protein [Microbacterium sp. zg-Y818]|uniref:FABP family protein n=3 Tax=Microbacterium TaxID=33882 RepID=UPI00214B2FD3|nr:MULTISPECIES: FABP family protein [unclassified Microbacterium]MCR2799585.1 FABP family protein [Microbacterium sp. zg.Y818]WIM21578.1 FABP family protein [Microbacterium sp. zg-Y818]